MNKFSISRRQFLRQTSRGAAGLSFVSGALRVFASDNSDTNLPTTPGPARDFETKPPFEPVRYHPIAAAVTGFKETVISLDGVWQIDPNPGDKVLEQPLNSASWRPFQVPGQWVQQGYDIPKEKSVAVAKEFIVPMEWTDYRVFLRFDAIHAGTNHRLNGQVLGYSENLFTPVEWEITNAAKFGQTNRLDLDMRVATASERLSYSSGYTGYSLGGIDRSVKIYALPKLHISRLHLNAGLDKDYQNGELKLTFGFDNANSSTVVNALLTIALFGPDGKRVNITNPAAYVDGPPPFVLDPLKPGLTTVNIETQVNNPLKWNAEQPNLYKLILVLEHDGQGLEVIERHIGFRTVETKGRQLYVNGVRVKLAGVCHHEIDPLTGRANTMRHAEEDVKWFKRANINLVRTSHYPCTQEFLDAADRYGLYIESEAPLCWVAPAKDLSDLPEFLTATSAMIDYNHSHPCVIIWSLANESHWSDLFKHSDKLVKELDATRPTTVEGVFSRQNEETCSILSKHYQRMPYDNVLKDDSRPFLHGECFFLVYHERTDVAIDPGLRELWAWGSADPDSALGKAAIANVSGQGLCPGVYPGAWSYIYHSNQCIGSEIWSGVDDIAFLPDGKVVSSENGNAYWGLIDGWRRPKPELWLSKFLYSPVWFPARQLDYQPSQTTIRVPVENRYSFANLSELEFHWEVDGAKGKVHIDVPPASKGELEIPVHKSTPQGATLFVRVMRGSDEVVNAMLTLGERTPSALPLPDAGVPAWHDDGGIITVKGHRFSLALERATGEFDATSPKHKAPLISFPSLHVATRDFGDLDRKKPARVELPDPKTRIVESITTAVVGDALELTMKDRYDHFAGSIRWLLDKTGAGKISYDYTYTGDNLDAREIGIKALLPLKCDKIQWRRWSEWGVFPDDSISRTEGTARAHRDPKWPQQPANVKPLWPWSQDETELGTADFRSIKFCIYEASLLAPSGSGVRVDANADVHFRARLSEQGVKMHVLTQCPLIQTVLAKGARLTGEFTVRLLA